MNYRQIAELIPEEYRKELLETNMISKASAVASNASMFYLFTIWSNYVEPGLEIGCGSCLERILNNYEQLLPTFIELEKSRKLLNEA